ncbi:MAG: DUF4157 domain-containing protein [Anaerolineae bacterium]|nr:DUF4157 domain-containing protein [Anaerolineae bacterium]
MVASQRTRLQQESPAPQLSGEPPASERLSAPPVSHLNRQATIQQSRALLGQPVISRGRTLQRSLIELQKTHGNQAVQRLMRATQGPMGSVAPEVESAIQRSRGLGQGLDHSTQAQMETVFGTDFSHVRLHTGSDADVLSQSLAARAFTTGSDIYFRQGEYNPGTSGGRSLLAHELTHVVQQRGAAPQAKLTVNTPGDVYEQEADAVAARIVTDTSRPAFQATEVSTATRPTGSSARMVQRVVEMRDVGKGEQSGFARLPELINRLNTLSQGLTFSMNGARLEYIARPGGTLSKFDQMMQGFIDQSAIIPLRLTNRQGLAVNRQRGWRLRVDIDGWSPGYVDIDDLLASDDLGLQMVLAHFMRERSATGNYARRIGSDSVDLYSPNPVVRARVNAEFQGVHRRGIDAEAQVLQDFFGDNTIRLVADSTSPTIRRVFRNSRGDRIRRRVTHGTGSDSGVDAMSVEVITRSGKRLSAEDYRKILQTGAPSP